MRTPDPLLAEHLLACPPCRDVHSGLVGVPAHQDSAPPSRVWTEILREVRRCQRVERRRQRHRPLLRQPRR